MEKVQRLSGSGLGRWPRLKIESGPLETEPWDERPNQPGAQGASVQTGGNNRGEPAEGSLNRSNPLW
jgi:hypothetical protein